MTEESGGHARLQAFVSGAVQGVGYRHFALSTALKLGISGWVRNLPDGSVQVVAEGPREALEVWLNDLRKGPYSGRVDDVRFSWFPSRGEFDRFEVRF